MRWVAVAAMVAAGIEVAGQESTRVGQILAERERKEQELKPEEPSKLERRLNWVTDAGLLERANEGFHGLRLKIGGLAPGGGFAAGPEYLREGLWNGRLNLRT